MDYAKKYKIILVGDSLVGKTSIISVWNGRDFNLNVLGTTGVDTITKDIEIESEKIRIKVWDTAGQERYRAVASTFFSNVDGVFLVYDVTNEESFNSINYWLKTINQKTKENVKKILVGNKIDLDRVISELEASSFASQNKIPYYETSAKGNINIKESFENLVLQLYYEDQTQKDILKNEQDKKEKPPEKQENKQTNKEPHSDITVEQNNKKLKKSKKCC